MESILMLMGCDSEVNRPEFGMTNDCTSLGEPLVRVGENGDERMPVPGINYFTFKKIISRT
jgi:hypothetical protein